MGVAEGVDGDSSHHVDVLAPLGVADRDPSPLYEGDGQPLEGAHQVLMLELLDVGLYLRHQTPPHLSAVTMVPMPASVNSSSSSESAARPSMMCAPPT